MTSDRFGLALSLVEALEAGPSPQATQLAELLTDTAHVKRVPRRPPELARRLLAGLAAAVSLAVGAQGQALAAGLEGRWVMDAPNSSFTEAVTGAAPDSAVLTVVRDDTDRLIYRLSEARNGVEVAHGAYDVSFAGGASQSRANGSSLTVIANRTAGGDVTIRAPKVGDMQAVIRLTMDGPDTATLEHDVEAGGCAIPLERLSLIRAGARTAPSESPTPLAFKTAGRE